MLVPVHHGYQVLVRAIRTTSELECRRVAASDDIHMWAVATSALTILLECVENVPKIVHS